MAKYIVQVPFLDLQDKKKEYARGDVYPSPANKKVSPERLEELLSTKSPREGRPYLKKVEDDKPEEKKAEKKDGKKDAEK